MELFFLCTALSLHVLDHCMKLYWKRKTQRTAGPTDPPTDHRVTPIYPPKLRFGGIIKKTKREPKTHIILMGGNTYISNYFKLLLLPLIFIMLLCMLQ